MSENGSNALSIAAVVVTYNRKELLSQNIQALLAQTYDAFDVFIIDNASTDGTEDAVAPYLENSRIRYENTGTNLGGAGGFNYGMRLAFENGYEYVWLMDDDTLPKSDALEALIMADKALGGTYGFLSSIVLWKDGAPCRMNIQAVNLRKKIMLSEDITQMPQTIPILYATFVSFFIKREIVLDVGLPIKEFFIWADDWEFSRRISRKYPCYVVGKSIATHACEDNNGSNLSLDDETRLWRYWYAYRNEVYVFRREGFQGWAWIIAKNLWNSLRVAFRSRNMHRKRLGVLWKGFFCGVRFKPEIEFIESRPPQNGVA